MMAISSTHAHLLAATLGPLIYIFHFHRGEHHLYPQRNLQYLFVSFILLFTVTKYHPLLDSSPSSPSSTPHPLNTTTALYTATTLTTTTLFSLLTTLLTYRLLLNPLNRFPGYKSAPLSALGLTLRIAKNLNKHHVLYTAHQKHGKFVRTGPNDLSVSDADVVRVALSPTSKCIKAPWYQFEYPAYSLFSVRDKTLHDKRRRVWSPAFSERALRGYEARIETYNDKLLGVIEESIQNKRGELNISKVFNCWSFDIMGDLAFGKSFDMLSSEKGHWAINLLTASQAGGGLFLPPWLARFLISIPQSRDTYHAFVRFCSEQIESRMEVQGKQENPDITHFLIEDFLATNGRDGASESERKVGMDMLHFDSLLVIIAGSDTTASTAAFLFYHLIREPGLLERVRSEIEQLLSGSGSGSADAAIDNKTLLNAPLLNGCIYETLRLHPAVPSGLYRKTPPEGVFVGETYVPGNTTMLVNFYALGREESHFESPNAFIPERFSSRPDLIKHKDAFVPFSTGPYVCIGKNLALMELRLVTAHLVTRFDMGFAEGEDGAGILNSHDYFTTGLEPLRVVFKKREERG